MGILDWFKNRSAQFDPNKLSDEIVSRAVERVVTLTNPRLKLLDSYQARMAPSVRVTIQYFRECVQSLPPSLSLSAAHWALNPALRAFFVTATDIPGVLVRSPNLKTFLKKFPTKDKTYFILEMKYNEQDAPGVAMHGDVVRKDITQRIVSFSEHQIRICGESELEIRRLLGNQGIEYLVAQALAEIGKERAERQELQDTRALIRTRLRVLQQHGPGLGSMFASAPERVEKQAELEAQLLENERQLEALGSLESSLTEELETLCRVFEQPEQYITVERQQLKLNSMNVVLDNAALDVASEIDFPLVTLLGGLHSDRRALVFAYASRSEVPENRINLAEAERYL